MTPATLAALHAAAQTEERAWSESEFADLLAQRGVFALGDATCAALGRVVADEAELLTIATHPAARRQGRARAMLAAYEAEAARRGATTAFLEVRAGNAAALALYRSAGYRETGRRRGYYKIADGARDDAILFSRSLTPCP